MERASSRGATRRLPAICLLGTLAWGPFAQDEAEPVPHGPGEHGAELRRLFHEAERGLQRIDVLLTSAGSGEAEEREPGSGGLDGVLRRSHDLGDEVVRDIDEILRLLSGAT